jgi:phosphatidylglycerol---prolipoprotein diacylglyceryl transferase
VQPWLVDVDLPLVGRVLIRSYFFFLMLGCLVASEVAIREARRSGESPREVLGISVAAILAGLLGARAAHFAFVSPQTFKDDPLLSFLRVWEGGLVFYGGFIGGILAVVILCRIRGLSLLRFSDLLCGPVMLGLAFGRVGCLHNGCCYGRPIDWGTGVEWPWAVTFLRGEVPSALRGIPLHPSQAYAALNALALFGVYLWLRRRQRFDGQVFGTILVAYGLTRSLLELVRLDLSRNFWFEDQIGQVLSTSQGISIPMVLVGVALLVHGARKQASAPTAA